VSVNLTADLCIVYTTQLSTCTVFVHSTVYSVYTVKACPGFTCRCENLKTKNDPASFVDAQNSYKPMALNSVNCSSSCVHLTQETCRLLL